MLPNRENGGTEKMFGSKTRKKTAGEAINAVKNCVAKTGMWRPYEKQIRNRENGGTAKKMRMWRPYEKIK